MQIGTKNLLQGEEDAKNWIPGFC